MKRWNERAKGERRDSWITYKLDYSISLSVMSDKRQSTNENFSVAWTYGGYKKNRGVFSPLVFQIDVIVPSADSTFQTAKREILYILWETEYLCSRNLRIRI